jgi:predicted porin
MKKSLLALAVLTAFAGAASAQSSVTIGGKIDLAVGKLIGSADKGLFDTPGSRLNFGGREDLGGGMAAVFGIEHRFSPDTGTSTSATNFWNGYSWVGLNGGFGTVRLGRDYTSAFINVQNQVDPFGGDNAGALRAALLAGVAKVRFANGVKYFNTMGGLSMSYDISEGGVNNTGAADATVVNKPWSGSVTYAAGPVWLAFSHENPGGKNDKLTTLGARFAMGPAVLRAGMSNGTNNANAKVKSYLLGANIRMGAGDIRLGYATLKTGSVTSMKRLGVGYHYDLSKRTKVYATLGRDSATAFKAEPTGFDFGIQHNF